MNLKTFKYSNIQHKYRGGRKTTRKVCIHKGKGYKCVTQFRGTRRIHHAKKPLTPNEIGNIKMGKFIPGLFKDVSNFTLGKR
jgi:hypothetical protein